jgi:anion-transporting  ArsA/GET3 family ATPase
MSIAELLSGKRVCVCGGAGGVGKTTSAAAIALGMAVRGARVAVVTIDPARRLADALGVQQLCNEPRQVDPARLRRGAIDEVRGELWAMMLDPKRTFDELIERIAPDARRAAEIKKNRIYRELSSAVSGSQEFTAISKLCDLAAEERFDLLVLDTPPSRNALDFLDAPRRLTSFLDGQALRIVARPAGVGARTLGRGASPLLGLLRRLTGIDLLADLSTFFGLLGDMTEDFSQRAAQVQRLLRSPQTAFLLVTSAQSEPIDEALWLGRSLRDSGLPFAGVIVNRVHHGPASPCDPQQLATLLADHLKPALTSRVLDNFTDYHVLARRDRRNIARLAAELDGQALIEIPQLDGDVHDIAALASVSRFLFATPAQRRRLLAPIVS